MAADDVRKNLNLFVDGRGYAGQIEDFNAPKLALKVAEWHAGGMASPIDLKMGLEKMTTDFALLKYDRDVLSLFGVANGQSVAFVAREALESFDGTVTPVVHTMRGRITNYDPGTSKAGEMATLRMTLTLNYYKLQHGATTVQEIDAINMVHIVGGQDVYAQIRSALGM